MRDPVVCLIVKQESKVVKHMVSIPTLLVTDYRDALNGSVGIFLQEDVAGTVRQGEAFRIRLM